MVLQIESKCPSANYTDVFPAFLTTHITLLDRVVLGSSNVHFSTFSPLLCIMLGSVVADVSGIIGSSFCDRTELDFYCRKCSVLRGDDRQYTFTSCFHCWVWKGKVESYSITPFRIKFVVDPFAIL
jgi:hypothetical protein